MNTPYADLQAAIEWVQKQMAAEAAENAAIEEAKRVLSRPSDDDTIPVSIGMRRARRVAAAHWRLEGMLEAGVEGFTDELVESLSVLAEFQAEVLKVVCDYVRRVDG